MSLKVIRNEISAVQQELLLKLEIKSMHALLRLLLFGRFLDSLLIFIQKAIQPLHQKPAEQEH